MKKLKKLELEVKSVIDYYYDENGEIFIKTRNIYMSLRTPDIFVDSNLVKIVDEF